MKKRKMCLSGVNATDYYIMNANLYLDVNSMNAHESTQASAFVIYGILVSI